jgi:translation elongation factor EF-1alpha
MKNIQSSNTLGRLISLEKISKSKRTINVGVFGHVDSGKSTLLGHLFYKLEIFTSRELHKTIQESKMAGKSTSHFAWLLDEMDEERKKGVTIDTNERTIEWDN